jgi:hypothetical protein
MMFIAVFQRFHSLVHSSIGRAWISFGVITAGGAGHFSGLPKVLFLYIYVPGHDPATAPRVRSSPSG